MIAVKRTLSVVAALVFTLGALAGQTGSRNDGSRKFQLGETAVLLGVTVPPGSYTLSWTRDRGSEAVRIELASGRKVLATGKGLWVESEQPYPYEALVYHAAGGGTNELAEIRFSRSVDSIRIEAGTARAEARSEERTGTD